jgi:hypothetical protein
MRKTKLLLLLAFAILATGNIKAQTSIAIQNNGQAEFFGNFVDALEAAQNGDTIYLPGGNFYIGSVSIDKKLIIIGAGHYPAYTQATGITSLHGDITLLPGADYTHLQGFYLTSNIRLGNSSGNQEVNNIIITRCNINELRLNYDGGSTQTTSQNIMVLENVIRGQVYGGQAQYVFFSKNLFGSRIVHFNGNATFTNNIFLKQTSSWSDYIIGTTQSTSFYNNIFLATNYVVYGSSLANIYNNNIFVENFTLPAGSTGANNIVNKPLAEIFIDHTGNVFSYESDFHLAETSGGIGAGTDDNDIGIYGTNFPYKEGAVPFNPYIVSGLISPETDENGNIQVNISVEAQER